VTEEVIDEYTIISKEQLNDTVKKSNNAFLEWKQDIYKRADFLYAFAKHPRLDLNCGFCYYCREFTCFHHEK
jgi:acyl-CoA reductase-like NAD-dependent aldehyde dehydrogenase